jgi:hypothetical protein
MGILSDLISRTGPYKLAAAKNALIAKYMFINSRLYGQMTIDSVIRTLLVGGKISSDEVDASKLKEDRYYGMAALAFHCVEIPPTLKGITFRSAWNEGINPITALSGAASEIDLVINEINRKFGIMIDLSQSDTPHFSTLIKAPHHIILISCLNEFLSIIDGKICDYLRRHDIDFFKEEVCAFCSTLISEWYAISYRSLNNNIDDISNAQLKLYWESVYDFLKNLFGKGVNTAWELLRKRYDIYTKLYKSCQICPDDFMLSSVFISNLTPCEGLDDIKDKLTGIIGQESKSFVELLKYIVLINQQKQTPIHDDRIRFTLRDDD